MIQIGVISDTHGLLRPEAVALLEGCDHIVHGGDIGDPAILGNLAEIAPVTAVRGNADRGPWVQKISETEVLEVGEISIYVIHNLQELDLKPEAAGFAAVIYGHSHVPEQEMRNGVLYLIQEAQARDGSSSRSQWEGLSSEVNNSKREYST